MFEGGDKKNNIFIACPLLDLWIKKQFWKEWVN